MLQKKQALCFSVLISERNTDLHLSLLHTSITFKLRIMPFCLHSVSFASNYDLAKQAAV